MADERPAAAMAPEPPTFFAPAERATTEEAASQARVVEETPLFQAVLDSIDSYIMVLNDRRQVLAANQRLLDDLGVSAAECIMGMRPGEALGCVHANEGPGGCGTSRNCSQCGAVIAILACQAEHATKSGECLASVRRCGNAEAVEMAVRCSPVSMGGHDFSVLVLNDISGNKRRDALERIFFHDILNTIGGLLGWSCMLEQMEGLDPRQIAQRIVTLSNRLAQEVQDQRRLSQAEGGTLDVALREVSVPEIFGTLKTVFAAHDTAKGKVVEFPVPDPQDTFQTDPGLLVRVLTNMIKNALEASLPGETISVAYSRVSEGPMFAVNNQGAMPEDVALRVFKRSFSTKGQKGRGLGTYSMKLFGERYLGGQVYFETSKDKGTTFFIRLPERPEAAKQDP